MSKFFPSIHQGASAIAIARALLGCADGDLVTYEWSTEGIAKLKRFKGATKERILGLAQVGLAQEGPEPLYRSSMDQM